MYVKYPLSLRNIEVLLHERGIDICHETVRFWWNRFGPPVRDRHPSAAGKSDAWPSPVAMLGWTASVGIDVPY